jgi:threonylcarbamoyladenosine tRNA methylthiotransferase MtaB
MKISFYNIGCKLNFAELSTIRQELEKRGHETVDFGTDEDAVIINTCTVTNNADSDSRKIIRRALRKNPNAFIGVIGCYAELKPEDIAAIDGVDAIFGMKEKFDIIDYIDNHGKNNSPAIFVSNNDDLPFHTACSEDDQSRTRMIFKLQDGCDYSCTFCTIPKARGKSRSMPFDMVKTKFLELQKADKYEIVLSGVNLGEYSAPTGEKFYDVLKFIDTADLKQRVRISSIEPNMLKPEIVNLVARSERICSHFHIPLQSGSPDILKAMQRRYNVPQFTNLINNISDTIPDVCIGIDVIVGFPGETEKHFSETYDLLESLPISYLHVFTYSERQGTPAADLPDKVPHDIRKNRTKLLRRLSEEKKLKFYREQLGSVQTVIPEQYDEKTGLWSGWTDNYVRVLFKAPETLEHKPLNVRLSDISNGNVFAHILK